MMKKENIQQLLEKYLEGESSLLEEKQLHHYFLYEEVAPELENYRILFTVFEEDKNIICDIKEEDLILKTETRRISWTSQKTWAIAASIIVLLSLSWFLNQPSLERTTLNQEEIQIAQKYLSMGFEGMDKGLQQGQEMMRKTAVIETQTLELGKMGEIYQNNIEKLNHVNRIDESLEKLQNISSMKKSKLKLVM